MQCRVKVGRRRLSISNVLERRGNYRRENKIECNTMEYSSSQYVERLIWWWIIETIMWNLKEVAIVLVIKTMSLENSCRVDDRNKGCNRS